MTTQHDYEAASDIPHPHNLKSVSEWIKYNENTIRHALYKMSRMERDNLVMVPREASEKMIIAGIKYRDVKGADQSCRPIYRAMITAYEKEGENGN